MTALRLIAAAGLCALLAGGCGGGAARPQPRIALSVAEPADGASVTTASVTVSGTVSPRGASLLVLGRPVAVTDGSFSTDVALAPGANIIDLLAGSPHAQAAMATVSVTRIVLVRIPNLGGEAPQQAADRLTSLGLVANVVTHHGSFFSFLLPLSPQVCSTSPPAGRQVAPGTTVTVQAASFCGGL
jgi:hypothetical protein